MAGGCAGSRVYCRERLMIKIIVIIEFGKEKHKDPKPVKLPEPRLPPRETETERNGTEIAL